MKIILVVDGGTTNLRVTAVSAAEHQVLAHASAAGGVKHTAVDGNNHRLKALLKQCIDEVLASAGCRTEDVGRCIAFGMITSNMGLYELPHLIAPVSLQDLRNGMKSASFPEIVPFPIEFIPGVRNFSGRVGADNVAGMDMMRGEEVEAIGLYDLMRPEGRAMFVLPGSHNKFVSMDEDGRILGCMTSISGELLDVITHDTILADSVERSFCTPETYSRDMAIRGAEECAKSGLGRAAFAGRILNTLGKLPTGEIQSWLLGAVLMEDVRAMKTAMEGTEGVSVYVAGKPPVQKAVSDILACSGMKTVEVDPELSARMGLHGALTIAGQC